jgi:[ribosomal protein S5]-alanine N-acetyltransferase
VTAALDLAPRTRARRGPPTLATPRLVLRPLVPGDTSQVAALAGDPRVAFRLDRVPSPFPHALAARWIARRNLRWHERKGVTLAVMRTPPTAGEPELLGTVSLRVSRVHRHAELGYWLGAAAWGGGIATEAAGALVAWGFTALRLHRVHVRVLADNPASRRVVEKLGFVVEGVRREHYRRGDEFLDVIELGLARDAWEARVAGAASAAAVRPAASRSRRRGASASRSSRRPRRS